MAELFVTAETDCRVDNFLDFMQIDGHPIVSEKVIEWLICNKFFTAPAAAKHHGNRVGGLYDHSKAVARNLVWITNQMGLKWKRPESPYIVGMFHDICKVDQYRPVSFVEELAQRDAEGNLIRPGKILSNVVSEWEFVKDTPLAGHGDKSVMMLASLMKLTEEEVMCIRYHMGAFTDKSEWGYYTRAVQNYPNVLWTHTADMLASQVEGI